MVLKLQGAPEPPSEASALISRLHTLSFWYGWTWEFYFLTSSHEMLMLQIRRLYFEDHWVRKIEILLIFKTVQCFLIKGFYHVLRIHFSQNLGTADLFTSFSYGKCLPHNLIKKDIFFIKSIFFNQSLRKRES